MSETNIPFGSEFSPSQTELPQLLVFCKTYSGNKIEIESKILDTFLQTMETAIKKSEDIGNELSIRVKSLWHY